MNSSSRATLNVFIALLLGAVIFYAGMAFAFSRNQYAPLNMMGGYGGGMMNGGAMMGSYSYGATSKKIEPVAIEQARTAIESYIDSLGNTDLAIKEIMIFDNGGYAIVKEQSSGIGAFELLVDPVGLFVFPEYGPNMMWNLKYGMMGRGGMMGGWYGGAQSVDVSSDMPLRSEQARQIAQKYLDAFLPGATATDEVTAFYGYYTIDIEKDRKIVGMLSVNGFSEQVFLHTWHGNFIEMDEE